MCPSSTRIDNIPNPYDFEITGTVDISVPLPPTLYLPTNGSIITISKPAFDWSDVSGAAEYRIQVDTDNNFGSPDIDTTVSLSSYTSIVDLVSGETYYWHVKTKDSFNTWGGWSSSPNFTVILPPADPTGLILTVKSDSKINLNWNDVANNEDGYKVERKPDGGVYEEIQTLGAGANSYSATSLSEKTKYWFRVRAYNIAGNSGYSNEAYATTCPTKIYVSDQNGTMYGDCHVMSSGPDENFSDGEMLYLKRVSSPFSMAIAYIGIDISSISSTATILTARLYMYPQLITGETNVAVRPITSSWSVNTVTWNSRPSRGSEGDWNAFSAYQWYWWDITSYAQSWQSGSTNYGVSLETILSDEPLLKLYTSNVAAYPEYRPYIEFTYQ